MLFCFVLLLSLLYTLFSVSFKAADLIDRSTHAAPHTPGRNGHHVVGAAARGASGAARAQHLEGLGGTEVDDGIGLGRCRGFFGFGEGEK